MRYAALVSRTSHVTDDEDDNNILFCVLALFGTTMHKKY